MAITCLVLDCDGVILESVPIKTRVFSRMVESYGEEAHDRMLMYHKVHGGMSRYKKFAWFFREILGREITPEELQAWGQRFADIGLDEVSRCDLVPGIEDVLMAWKGKIPIYVCSGASQEELRHILTIRGLDHYFTGIYGSPPSKTPSLQRIVTLARVDPADVLMVGDSLADQDAAIAVGTLFYGRGAEVKGCTVFEDDAWGEDLTALNAYILKSRCCKTHENMFCNKAH